MAILQQNINHSLELNAAYVTPSHYTQSLYYPYSTNDINNFCLQASPKHLKQPNQSNFYTQTQYQSKATQSTSITTKNSSIVDNSKPDVLQQPSTSNPSSYLDAKYDPSANTFDKLMEKEIRRIIDDVGMNSNKKQDMMMVTLCKIWDQVYNNGIALTEKSNIIESKQLENNIEKLQHDLLQSQEKQQELIHVNNQLLQMMVKEINQLKLQILNYNNKNKVKKSNDGMLIQKLDDIYHTLNYNKNIDDNNFFDQCFTLNVINKKLNKIIKKEEPISNLTSATGTPNTIISSKNKEMSSSDIDDVFDDVFDDVICSPVLAPLIVSSSLDPVEIDNIEMMKLNTLDQKINLLENNNEKVKMMNISNAPHFISKSELSSKLSSSNSRINVVNVGNNLKNKAKSKNSKFNKSNYKNIIDTCNGFPKILEEIKNNENMDNTTKQVIDELTLNELSVDIVSYISTFLDKKQCNILQLTNRNLYFANKAVT